MKSKISENLIGIRRVIKGWDFLFIFLILITLVFIAIYSFIDILKLKNFSSSTFDIGSYAHAYYRIIHGQVYGSLYLEYILTIAIFAPLWFWYIPVFHFFHKLEVLLVLHNLILFSASIPMFLFVRQRFKDAYIAFIFSLIYITSQYVRVTAGLGFIPFIPAVPAFFLMFYYLEKKDFKYFILCAVVINLIKIDLVIMNMLFGACLLLKRNYKFGRPLFLLSLYWILFSSAFLFFMLKLFNVSFPVSMPHLQSYGTKIAEVISNFYFIIINKADSAWRILDIFISIGPVVILAFLCPIFLIPLLVELFYVYVAGFATSGLVLLAPFVFFSAIYGLEKALNLINILNVNKKRIFFKKFYLGNISMLKSLVIFLFFCIFWSYFVKVELFKTFYNKSFSVSKHALVGHKFIKMIPKEASCVMEYTLANYLGERPEWDIFSLNYQGFLKDRSEFFFFDLSLPAGSFLYPDPRGYWNDIKELLNKEKYGVFAYEDGWLILKKGFSTLRNREILDLYTSRFMSQ